MRAEKNYYGNGWFISFEHNGWDTEVVGQDNIISNQPLWAGEDGVGLDVDTYGPTKKRRTGRFYFTFLRSIDEVY